jgi:hypothetical protein
VWHEGLIHKINKMLLKQYVEIVTSYISERLFRIKQEEGYSDLKAIQAGVPQIPGRVEIGHETNQILKPT